MNYITEKRLRKMAADLPSADFALEAQPDSFTVRRKWFVSKQFALIATSALVLVIGTVTMFSVFRPEEVSPVDTSTTAASITSREITAPAPAETTESTVTIALSPYDIIRVSPDGTKTAFISWLDGQEIGHRGGPLHLFDTENKQSFELRFEHIDYSAWVFAPTDVAWLDDENLIVIISFAQGSATRGGWIYFYNLVTGENRLIVDTDGERIEFTDLDAVGDELRFTVNIPCEQAMYWEEYSDSIPLSFFREAIRDGGMVNYRSVGSASETTAVTTAVATTATTVTTAPPPRFASAQEVENITDEELLSFAERQHLGIIDVPDFFMADTFGVPLMQGEIWQTFQHKSVSSRSEARQEVEKIVSGIIDCIYTIEFIGENEYYFSFRLDCTYNSPFSHSQNARRTIYRIKVYKDSVMSNFFTNSGYYGVIHSLDKDTVRNLIDLYVLTGSSSKRILYRTLHETDNEYIYTFYSVSAERRTGAPPNEITYLIKTQYFVDKVTGRCEFHTLNGSAIITVIKQIP
jgi:hypothetical protein